MKIGEILGPAGTPKLAHDQSFAALCFLHPFLLVVHSIEGIRSPRSTYHDFSKHLDLLLLFYDTPFLTPRSKFCFYLE